VLTLAAVLVVLGAGQNPVATLERQAAEALQAGGSFPARAEIAEKVGRAVRRSIDVESGGRLALLYIHTMRSALVAIPMDSRDREPYASFVMRHESEAVYSEPAGQWMLRPDAIWALHEANRSSTSAEAIAWQAVDNGMPGECEGYPPCELATIDALDGEYLRQHPDGTHAGEAIARIRDTCRELERLLAAPNGHELFDPVADCKDLGRKADAVRHAMQGARTDATEALAALSALQKRCP
jgi:hypothetical protein